MEPPSSGRIDVIDNSGRRLPGAGVKRAVRAALQGTVGDVCVVFTTDEEIRAANRDFRGVDEATDVLTFPAAEQPASPNPSVLGDIMIAIPYAERQAELRGVSLAAELQFLAIHGTLHLLGWDDETEEDRQAMMAEMNRIGQGVGLPPDPEWSSLLHGEPA